MNPASAVDEPQHLEQIILQVVRGERPWSVLEALGFYSCQGDGRWTAANPHHIVVPVEVADLAVGLLAYRKDKELLLEWAKVLEIVDCVNLDVEEHPQGAALLDALWSASFGEPIADSVWVIAEGLAQSPGRNSGSPV